MAASIANSNLSDATVSRLLSGGWDINAMTNLAAAGTDVNDLVTRNQWDQLTNSHSCAHKTHTDPLLQLRPLRPLIPIRP
jgi:hypothetical protein